MQPRRQGDSELPHSLNAEGCNVPDHGLFPLSLAMPPAIQELLPYSNGTRQNFSKDFASPPVQPL